MLYSGVGACSSLTCSLPSRFSESLFEVEVMIRRFPLVGDNLPSLELEPKPDEGDPRQANPKGEVGDITGMIYILVLESFEDVSGFIG